MRALIVAALLASAAAAHDCVGVRGCSGIENNLGICTTRINGYAALCGALSHPRGNPDDLERTDYGCFNIKPAFAQLRDDNGTVAAEGMFYASGGGAGKSFSAAAMGGGGGGALPSRCGHERDSTPYCTTSGENNGTVLGANFGYSTYVPNHVAADGTVKYGFSVSSDIMYVTPRQDFNLKYVGDDKTLSVSRGSALMQVSVEASGPFSSMASSYKASSETLWVLFRISNQGGNPFDVSLGSGDRATANGATFLEKLVTTTGTYVASSGTTPGYMRYTHNWYSPDFEVLERYELNADTWKYEKHQFLALKVAYDNINIMATVPKPGMDSGVAQLASLAAAAVAAVVAMMMATA